MTTRTLLVLGMLCYSMQVVYSQNGNTPSQKTKIIFQSLDSDQAAERVKEPLFKWTSVAGRTLQEVEGPFQLEFVRLSGEEILQLQLQAVQYWAEDATIRTASGLKLPPEGAIRYFQGKLLNAPGSQAAFHLSESGLNGVIRSEALAELRIQNRDAETLRMYAPPRMTQNEGAIYCDTPDDHQVYQISQLKSVPGLRQEHKVVEVYLEVDHDIFLDKGGLNPTRDFITRLFHETAVLFAAEGIHLKIADLFIWDIPSPYVAADASALLDTFQKVRTQYNGYLGQLLSYKAKGGIAASFSGLCNPDRSAALSFCSIKPDFHAADRYSFSVMVMAHELGHLMGLRHTHACVWNGDGTALDGCAGFTEGSCPNGPIPAEGGTLMSYCHLTRVGVDFQLGFGEQPGHVLNNRVAQATCLSTFSTPDSSNLHHQCQNEFYLELKLDRYGNETTYEVMDTEGRLLHSGGPFPDGRTGMLIRDTFCLPDACGTFVLKDTYGDGICCSYGSGGFSIFNSDSTIHHVGGAFRAREVIDLCSVPSRFQTRLCESILLDDHPLHAWEEEGSYRLISNNRFLQLSGATLVALELPTFVDTSTYLTFEFGATRQGALHGIGFHSDARLEASSTFQLFGTDAVGIQHFNNYPGHRRWQRFDLPIGLFLQGNQKWLYFISPEEGNSYFRNLKIYQESACDPEEGSLALGDPLPANDQPVLEIKTNPVANNLTIRIQEEQGLIRRLPYRILSADGWLWASGTFWANSGWTGLPAEILPPGLYLIQLTDQTGGQINKKFIKH